MFIYTSFMNHLLFLSAFFGVFVLLYLYIWRRFVLKLELSEQGRLLAYLFLLLNLVGIGGYIAARYVMGIPNWLYFLFSIPIGILFLLFCTAVFYDISHTLLHRIKLSQPRRAFFKKALDLSSFGVATALSGRSLYEARLLEVTEVNVPIKHLQKPYTIAQISDLHIGGLIDRAFVQKMVQKVNALKVDLVVITGDLIDIDVTQAKETLEELKNFQTRFGTFYVVGNHEYFHGIEAIIASVKKLGIKVLENENVYIGEQNEGFFLAGVYDIIGYRVQTHMPDLSKALNGTQNSPTLLLAHQPKFIEEVFGGVDLMLSGHTHGGQLYPFRLLVKLQQPYVSGLHRHNKKLQIYVNKGTGFWGPPMRLGATAEISHITLFPQKKL